MIFILLASILVIATVVWWWLKPAKSRFQSKTEYEQVNPVSPDFNWATETPSKYRPFKPTYHLTMAVTRTSREEWLKIDSDYLEAMQNHQRTMQEHPDTTCMVQTCPDTYIAIHEMYDFIADTLVQRFPQYFVPQGKVLENKIRGSKIPRYSTAEMEPRECLKLLAGTLQEDVFVLQYKPDVEEYYLRATSGLAGLGFEWRTKVGLKLSDIHDPVPGYKEKLQKSMNRYFHKIVPGNFTQRITYGLMLGSKHDLYSSGNFSFRGGGIDVNNLDFENEVFVRLERQVLFRLPITQFLGFTIRTYIYSLAELKREGLGPACADALEAWPEDTGFYKGRHLWGDAVFKYLRSES